MSLPQDYLVPILSVLDRFTLVQCQLASSNLLGLVDRLFPQTPYHLFQLLEFRQANRLWLLNGEAISIRELKRLFRPTYVRCRRTALHMSPSIWRCKEIIHLSHVWNAQQLHVRWPPRIVDRIGQQRMFLKEEFANVLHTCHCRPSDELNVGGVVAWLCGSEGDDVEHARKNRLKINCGDWKREFGQLVEQIEENFKAATLPSTAFELILQIYPRHLCDDSFLVDQKNLVNNVTNELLRLRYWKEGYDNVASELRYFCRVRRLRLSAPDETNVCDRKRKKLVE